MCHDASRDKRLQELTAERDAARDPEAQLRAELRAERRRGLGPVDTLIEDEITAQERRLRALTERGAIGMLS